MRGRKPKPTRIKAIQGNPGKRAVNTREPRPRAVLPDCPDHLSDDAKREWKVMGSRLLALGLLTEIDRAALAAYCQAWGRWIEAERKIKEFGPVIKAPSGYPVQSPYLAIANKALSQMMKILTEFGMTPSSRGRIAASGDTEGLDDFETFLHGIAARA